MNQSEQINELATALAKAQAEIEKAEKRGANPHFRSRYSDLGAVWDAIREPLTKYAISVTQFPSTDFEHQAVAIRTRILHASGQWMEDRLSIPVSKWDAQGIGSAMTYGRRYSLMAVAGVAPNDDDGEAAVGRGKSKPAKQETQTLITTTQAEKIAEKLKQIANGESRFLSYFKLSKVSDLPADKFGKAMSLLDEQTQAQSSNQPAKEATTA